MATPSTASTIAEQIAEMEPVLIEHFNSSYADSLAVVGRAHSGLDDIVETEMTTMSCESFTLAVRTPHGVTAVIVPFERPLADLADIQPQSVAIVAAARVTLGIAELTSAEAEAAAFTSIPTHMTSVVAVEQVTPQIRQITFGGGDLINFRPVGPDQFAYVLAAAPGQSDLPIDAGFTWEWYDAAPENERPIGAYYTVRRWRPPAGGSRPELDMWFVLHGDAADPAQGPASAWAATVQPGEAVGLWGPRTAWTPPVGTEWYLLAGDETGLPAIAVILETLPRDSVVKAFIEIAGPDERVDLVSSPAFDVTWIERGGAPAGTTTLLAEAVRSMPWPAAKESAYVWGGGESRAMTAIRKYVRHEIGLPREAVSMTGYWRHADDTSTLADELAT